MGDFSDKDLYQYDPNDGPSSETIQNRKKLMSLIDVNVDGATYLVGSDRTLVMCAWECVKMLRAKDCASHANSLAQAVNEMIRSRKIRVRIMDDAAKILAGTAANPRAVDNPAWTRDSAAADAVHSAIALSKALDSIMLNQ